jgi:hypothetical protein
MIVIGFDLGPVQGTRMDGEGVADLLHAGAALGQLGAQGADSEAGGRSCMRGMPSSAVADVNELFALMGEEP